MNRSDIKQQLAEDIKRQRDFGEITDPKQLQFDLGSHHGTEINGHWPMSQWWDALKMSERLNVLQTVKGWDDAPPEISDSDLSLFAARGWRGLGNEWKQVLRKYYQSVEAGYENHDESLLEVDWGPDDADAAWDRGKRASFGPKDEPIDQEKFRPGSANQRVLYILHVEGIALDPSFDYDNNSQPAQQRLKDILSDLGYTEGTDYSMIGGVGYEDITLIPKYVSRGPKNGLNLKYELSEELDRLGISGSYAKGSSFEGGPVDSYTALPEETDPGETWGNFIEYPPPWGPYQYD